MFSLKDLQHEQIVSQKIIFFYKTMASYLRFDANIETDPGKNNFEKLYNRGFAAIAICYNKKRILKAILSLLSAI